jgi:hypothetical protein
LEYVAWERAPLASLVTKINADKFWRGVLGGQIVRSAVESTGIFAGPVENLQELDNPEWP